VAKALSVVSTFLAVFLTSITLRVRGVTFSGRPAGLH
jgi:hypothetical protein